MKFQFVTKVDEELFNLTRGAWSAQLGQNPEKTSATYYEAGLDFCHRTIQGKTLQHDGGGCVCAVVPDGSDFAAALIVVSHAKATSNLKMLDVYVQPELNLADSDPNYVELAWIAATAIVGCLELTYGTFPAQQLKMHTAFPLDKRFMIAVTTAIFSAGEWAQHYDVASQGQWLVVTKKKGPNGEHLRLAEG